MTYCIYLIANSAVSKYKALHFEKQFCSFAKRSNITQFDDAEFKSINIQNVSFNLQSANEWKNIFHLMSKNFKYINLIHKICNFLMLFGCSKNTHNFIRNDTGHI